MLTFENRSPNCVTRDKSSTKLTEVFQACLWPEKHFYMLPASGTSRKQTHKTFLSGSYSKLGRIWSFQNKSNYNRIQLWPLGSFGNQHLMWPKIESRNCIDSFSMLNYFLPSPLAAFLTTCFRRSVDINYQVSSTPLFYFSAESQQCLNIESTRLSSSKIKFCKSPRPLKEEYLLSLLGSTLSTF